MIGDVWVADGSSYRVAEAGEKGEIVIRAPYPYLARTIWGDVAGFAVTDTGAVPAWRGDIERYAATYWRRWPGTLAYTQGTSPCATTMAGSRCMGEATM